MIPAQLSKKPAHNRKYPFRELLVGDHFFVSFPQANYAKTSMWQFNKVMGSEYKAVSKLGEKDGIPGLWFKRIW